MNDAPAQPHLMLFDLYSEGHHLQYIQQLARYWVEHRLAGRLSIVVPAYFVEQHPWLPAFAEKHAADGIALVPIEEPVQVQTPRRLGLLRNSLDHGRFLKRYAEKLQPDAVLLLYFDHVQMPLARGLRIEGAPVLGGTYFRPSFHYGDFEAHPPSLKERIKRWRKRWLLEAALRNPQFRYLFCLDPYVVPHVEAMGTDATAIALPDGIEPAYLSQEPEQVRAQWGVDDGRKVALFFGAISARKGIFAVLEALLHLPPAAQAALCVVVAGKTDRHDREPIRQAVAQVQAETRVQLIVQDGFVPDEDVDAWIQAADLNLLVYRHHIGSSGVLVRAAAAQVPVLASDFGVLGEHVRRHRLGSVVDTADPQAIAQALAAWLRDPASVPFDADEAKRFADIHTAEAMAATIFSAFGFEQPRPDATIRTSV